MSGKVAPDEEIEDHLRLASPTIYEIIAWEGREELARPLQSLAWSGFVAGLCITFSLFCEAFIKIHTPANSDYLLLENLGYAAGFLIVILGRFQLFTENTITVILPLLENFSFYKFMRTMKLWGVVLLANFAGTFVVAWLITQFNFFSDAQFEVFIDVSKHAIDRDLGLIFVQAIPAGFLIASLVWMLPSAAGNQFWVIVSMIYIIAIGDFAHIVAGSVEAFLLLLNDHITLVHTLGYLFMAATGNIIGGTGLFAVMAYAQVRSA